MAVLATVTLSASSCGSDEKRTGLSSGGRTEPNTVATLQVASQAQMTAYLSSTEDGEATDYSYASARCQALISERDHIEYNLGIVRELNGADMTVQSTTAALYGEGNNHGVAYTRVDASQIKGGLVRYLTTALARPRYWVHENGNWRYDDCGIPEPKETPVRGFELPPAIVQPGAQPPGVPAELTAMPPVGPGANGGQLIYTQSLREGQCMPSQRPQPDPTALTSGVFEVIDCGAANANFTVLVTHEWTESELIEWGSPGEYCDGCPEQSDAHLRGDRFRDAYCAPVWADHRDVYGGWMLPSSEHYNFGQTAFFCTIGTKKYVDADGLPTNDIQARNQSKKVIVY